MYFKGKIPDGREIYSQHYINHSNSIRCTLLCEETEKPYSIELDTLEISFDCGETWSKYSDISKQKFENGVPVINPKDVKKMSVWTNEYDRNERYIIAKVGGRYIAVGGGSNEGFLKGERFDCIIWNNASPLPPTISIQEAEQKLRELGVEVRIEE